MRIPGKRQKKSPDFSELCGEEARVVQYSCSWILMLETYSRQSPNFSIVSISAQERLNVKMFDQRHVDSSVKWMKAKNFLAPLGHSSE